MNEDKCIFTKIGCNYVPSSNNKIEFHMKNSSAHHLELIHKYFSSLLNSPNDNDHHLEIGNLFKQEYRSKLNRDESDDIDFIKKFK